MDVYGCGGYYLAVEVVEATCRPVVTKYVGVAAVKGAAGGPVAEIPDHLFYFFG